MRIGDRFEHWNEKDQWEIIKITNTDVRIRCTKGTRTYVTGELFDYDMNFMASKHWTYLGNFLKSENYNNLYDILCEK